MIDPIDYPRPPDLKDDESIARWLIGKAFRSGRPATTSSPDGLKMLAQGADLVPDVVRRLQQLREQTFGPSNGDFPI